MATLPGATTEIKETTDTVTVHELAHAIWWPAYGAILSPEQITFMLEQIYAPDALHRQMQEGQVFLLLRHAGVPRGFAAYSRLQPDQHVYKLNKIYLHPDAQGLGLGHRLLQEVVTQVQALGGRELELNVHRQNPARHFYQKHGFEVYQTVDLPFGPFTLNDYVMRRKL